MFKKILSIALLLFALFACEETPEDKIIPVASVSLNQTEAEMLVGETLQLTAQISPADATDDAATAANAAWSIPTKAQWQELIDNCDITWVLTPVEGVRCTSRENGESIFLPAAGWKSDDDAPEALCWYWSKNLLGDSGAFMFDVTDGFASIGACTRYYGLSIRPVRQR